MRATTLVGIAFGAFLLALLVPAAANQHTSLSDACLRASDRGSCDELGDLLERGEVRGRYPEEAGLYFAMACEGGLARSCRRAQPWAKRYPDYEVFEIDVGCMLKHNAFACEEIADALRDERENEGAETDRLPLARSRMRRAFDLYLAGCVRDEAESCLGASRVYSGGFGVAWNPREARSKAARACTLGLAAACEKEGDDLTGADAIAPYRSACDLPAGSPHACLKLARTYEATGAPPAIVEVSYRRACERLSFDACLQVSRSLDRLDTESPLVVEAFRRWCDSGSPRACDLVSRLPGRPP